MTVAMNTAPLLLLLLTACVAHGALWQLMSQTSCFQPGVNPLKYNDYGCWCGIGGSGTPLDDLDRCCKVHDNCYETSRKTPGCTAIADLPYVISYDYTCSSKKVTCSAGGRRFRFLLTVAMNTTALLLLLTACVASGALLPKAVWHFGDMISCFQPGVNPLKYNDYGCWCGFGGSGTPLDDLDRCCKVHDNCYKASRLTPGCTAIDDLPYVISYDYKCSSNIVTCSGTNNKCQAAVCECDRVAAECFAQTKYNPDYKNVDTKVHCSN